MCLSQDAALVHMPYLLKAEHVHFISLNCYMYVFDGHLKMWILSDILIWGRSWWRNEMKTFSVSLFLCQPVIRNLKLAWSCWRHSRDACSFESPWCWSSILLFLQRKITLIKWLLKNWNHFPPKLPCSYLFLQHTFNALIVTRAWLVGIRPTIFIGH